MSPQSSAPGTAAVLFTRSRVRVALAGELDLACRSEVEEAFGDARGYELPIDLDLRNVTFMDSSVVTLVFTLAASSSLRVIGPNELVRFVFDVTGLTTSVEILDEDHPDLLAT